MGEALRTTGRNIQYTECCYFYVYAWKDMAMRFQFSDFCINEIYCISKYLIHCKIVHTSAIRDELDLKKPALCNPCFSNCVSEQ